MTESNKTADEESLIDFPCEFSVKVMGVAAPEFEELIHNIAKQHDAEFKIDETKRQKSKTGKYLSLTLNIHAKDKAQLDRLYEELSANELVLWAL